MSLYEDERPHFYTFLPLFDEAEVNKLASEIDSEKDAQMYIDQLSDPDADPTLFAMQVLIHAKNLKVNTQLISALKSDNINKLSCVIMVIGEKGMKQAVNPLLTLLQHEDNEIRCDVAGALSQIWDKRALEPLIKTLQNEEDEFVQACIAQALGEFEDQKAVPVLIDTFMKAWNKKTVEEFLGSAIVDALASIGGEQAFLFVAFINEQKEKFDKIIQSAIAKALTPMGKTNLS